MSWNRLYREYSGKYIVWIDESKKWYGFEEPAFQVFKMLETGREESSLLKHLMDHHNFQEQEASDFISETRDILLEITKKTGIKNNIKRTLEIDTLSSYIRHSYSIKNRIFNISYANAKLEYFFHPAILSYQTTPSVAETNFYISEVDDHYYLHRNSALIFHSSSFPVLKRELQLQILDLIYEHDRGNWFLFLHGALIAGLDDAFILCGPSGTGKSTLALHFLDRAYSVCSDDLVPLSGKDNRAYPVPFALSIKSGSFKTVDNPSNMRSTNGERICYENSRIRYYPLKDTFSPLEVKKVFFTRYMAESSSSISIIDKFKAFEMLHQEAWTSGARENAEKFISWFESCEFYELNYASLEEAEKLINSVY